MGENVVLRDFLYLDSEKLRSYCAQVLGGVPESAVVDSGGDASVVGSAEAGLLNFLKASGELGYTYRRSSSETSSLHHQVYTRFEEALEKLHSLETIDNSFYYDRDWVVEHFIDGAFVRLRGQIQLVDYRKVATSVETFPKLHSALSKIQLSQLKSQQEASSLSAVEANEERKRIANSEADVKKMPISDIVQLVNTLYSEGDIRIKIQPLGSGPDQVVVGNGRSSNLLFPLGSEGLLQSPDSANWVAVGQILAGTETNELRTLKTGNALEDTVDGLSVSFRSIVKVGSGVVFPAFEFIPLAVYREIPLV